MLYGKYRLRTPPVYEPTRGTSHPDLFFSGEPLDETLGHSFCYVRHNKLSPSVSGRFSPSSSGRCLPSSVPETTFFHSISGASVSANSSAPIALFSQPRADTDASHCNAVGKNGDNFFVGSSFFSSIPLQPIPRVLAQQKSQELGNSGRFERGFMSGPLERGSVSGPLENLDNSGVHFSAPLGGCYAQKKKKKKRKGLSGVAIKRAFGRNFSEKKRPWVFPVLSFVGLHHSRDGICSGGSVNSNEDCSRRYCDYVEEEGGSLDFGGDNLQWAQGKAGEDRVHLVVSEDNGWLFVGIYDGFNGPDAPEFLMANLYKAVFNELEGLFWENNEDSSPTCIKENEMKDRSYQNSSTVCNDRHPSSELDGGSLQDDTCISSAKDKCHLDETGGNRVSREGVEVTENSRILPSSDAVQGHGKRVTIKEEAVHMKRGKLLRELLAEEDDDAFSFWGSGSSSKAVAVQLPAGKDGDCMRVSSISMEDAMPANFDLQRRHGKGRSLLFSKLRLSFNKQKGNWRKSSSWSYDFDKEKFEIENQAGEKSKQRFRKCKAGPIDHEAVLKALSNALETTEIAYLDMTDKAILENPELALMGSCLLVVLMKEEDVYVMNVGDSRAIVAQSQPEPDDSVIKDENGGTGLEAILEDGSGVRGSLSHQCEIPAQEKKLAALQLSTDHSTGIEEEVMRIKREHPDDSQCIVNDRVKGRLKVTRAFGAGFLKQAKWNDALLEMFRNEYIGNVPYISCSSSLCHHRLGTNDQFLVLSSDGLYQYLSNEEVVSYVENFMEKFPDGDPAQYLIEELLFRAARKAGMEFHELLDIPQGDRRKYHDDVTVMVISLEGRIWKSSGKY